MFYTFFLKWTLNPWFLLISKSLPVLECRQKSFLGLDALLLIDIDYEKHLLCLAFLALQSLIRS